MLKTILFSRRRFMTFLGLLLLLSGASLIFAQPAHPKMRIWWTISGESSGIDGSNWDYNQKGDVHGYVEVELGWAPIKILNIMLDGTQYQRYYWEHPIPGIDLWGQETQAWVYFTDQTTQDFVNKCYIPYRTRPDGSIYYLNLSYWLQYFVYTPMLSHLGCHEVVKWRDWGVDLWSGEPFERTQTFDYFDKYVWGMGSNHDVWANLSDVPYDPVTKKFHTEFYSINEKFIFFASSTPYEFDGYTSFRWEVTAEVISEPEKPDLKFSDNPKITQVVPNPDINGDGRIDLVQGRKLLLTATVLAENVNPADTRELKIKISGSNIDPPMISPFANLSSFASPGKEVKFIFDVPDAGPQWLQIEINPYREIQEVGYENNVRRINYDVKPTKPFNIAYTWIRNDALYPVVTEFNETVSKSNEFISRVYPISSMAGTSQFNNEILGQFMMPDYQGMIEDAFQVALWSVTAGHDYGIGIVSKGLRADRLDGYFAGHGFLTKGGKPACGVAFPTKNVIAGLAEEGRWTVPAHELGHILGLCLGGAEEYLIPGFPNGRPVGGYRVPNEDRSSTEIANRFCFMGTAEYHSLDNNWVDDEHFCQLFKKFRSNPADPEILIFSAMLWKDGRIELRPSYYLPAGTPTESEEGNHLIRVLDETGQAISQLSFPVEFAVSADPIGIVPTDSMPLVVKLEFPTSAASIEIVRDGTPVVVVNPLSKLLVDAIKAIPQGAYVDSKAQGLKPLLNKAEAFEKMLSNGATKGALEKLQNDIRKHVDIWLFDSFQKRSPLEMTKEELLSLIDNLILRLKTRLS